MAAILHLSPMNDDTILIIAAAGIGIWAISKFAKPISDTLGGVGSAVGGVGQGVGTVGVELGESFKSLTDFEQAFAQRLTDAISSFGRGSDRPSTVAPPYQPTTYTVPTLQYDGKPSSQSFTLSAPVLPSVQQFIANDRQRVTDQIIAQSPALQQYLKSPSTVKQPAAPSSPGVSKIVQDKVGNTFKLTVKSRY